MAEPTVLDQAFHTIMRSFVDTGQAPHYTDLAKRLSISMEEGRQLLHDLADTGYSVWLHPGTDTIVSFAPFNNLPTHYRISIDGEQRWFAQ
jgi:hypothetical protein